MLHAVGDRGEQEIEQSALHGFAQGRRQVRQMAKQREPAPGCFLDHGADV